MNRAVTVNKQDIPRFLVIFSRTPLFLGLSLIVINLMIGIQFEYQWADLKYRFIFSGILIAVSVVLISVSCYLQKHLRK